MRRLLTLLLVVLTLCTYANAATFVSDEFTGGLGAWTISGDGTITTAGGFLSITSTNTTYDYIEQANITGEFDVVARIKDPFYPTEIDSAFNQCGLYVRVDDSNFVSGYQNRNNNVGKNEIMLQMYYATTPSVLNPACDPMEYVCIRAKRDATDAFYLYKNSATDCSGDWTEVGAGPLFRLVSSEPVSVIIRARAPEASTTYLVDYVRNFGEGPPVPATLSGGGISMKGGSFK